MKIEKCAIRSTEHHIDMYWDKQCGWVDVISGDCFFEYDEAIHIARQLIGPTVIVEFIIKELGVGTGSSTIK